jgi:hypothetical protein
MNEKTYKLGINLTEDMYLALKNKCHFYDIPMKDVIFYLVEEFLDGKFDKDLNLPVD